MVRTVCGTWRASCAPRTPTISPGDTIEIKIPVNSPNDAPTELAITTSTESETRSVGPVDQYGEQLDAFASAVRAGTPAPVPHATSEGPATARQVNQPSAGRMDSSGKSTSNAASDKLDPRKLQIEGNTQRCGFTWEVRRAPPRASP